MRHTLVLALAVFLAAPQAQAFFDPPWITPSEPLAGQTVSVNIRDGICDAIVSREGFPRITQVGNAIRIVEYGLHYEPGDELCVYDSGVLRRPIGAFLPGDYTLTVDLLYQHPFFGATVMNIGVVSFSVAAPPPPKPVPASNPLMLLVLVLAMVGLALWFLRARPACWLLLMPAFVPLDAHAQTVAVCVVTKDVPGAPTPQQVMDWVNSSSRAPKPPLEAYNVKVPLSSDWLIPDRASGDFLDWLNRNPHSVRKRLEDCQLQPFLIADLPAALAALQADPYVASATPMPEYELSGVQLSRFEIVPEGPLAGNDQYGWFAMNLDAAWRLAGGYALVGQIDLGLYEQHPALRQFNGNTYVGGNFVRVASRDVGLTGESARPGFDPMNVDEGKPMWISDPACASSPMLLPPSNMGHGTHVAGLLAANGASGLGVQGTCKQCGISVWKVTYAECFPTTSSVKLVFNGNAADRAQAQTVDIGVQVLSQSYGQQNQSGLTNCTAFADYPMCLTTAYAVSRDVPIVASSGNQREELNFPASDKRVISAGGFQSNLAFWDDAPNCPPAPATSQCGSNFSRRYSGGSYRTHQELLGSAKRVLSTAYPNRDWVAYGECGDSYGTPMGDGLGWCTGTSMSAPQIAGIVGLLRSVNPLVPTGSPEPAAGEKLGLRTVLARTANHASAWDPSLGYGIPNAEAATHQVLGKVAGVTVRNRVTPLFRLYQSVMRDFAETTSPQYALSLMINQDKNYVQPVSGLGSAEAQDVPGYKFPYDADATDGFYEASPATPRAAIYVLTTEHRPRDEWPSLVPLHLMSKDYSGGKDHLLATTKAEIEAAYAAGYNLRTIQGYIYQPCTPEPDCIPPAAQKLWRQYKVADKDCAVFLNDEKPDFEADGYVTACLTGSTKMIGYAYPATDSDKDGLPDGFEYVVGTNPNAADSDGDGVADGVELPLAGVPVSDPCMGGTLGARNCGADVIFRNGFDGR